MTEFIRSLDELVELIHTRGFVPFFKNSIPGFSLEELTPPELWFSDEQEGPWEWKGPAIRNSGCAYGKFFSGKAVFVSPEFFPHFANLRREGLDFWDIYDEGRISHAQRELFELLEEEPSLLSRELKRRGGFSKEGKKGFDGLLTKLQMGCFVVISDFEYQKDKYGLPYGFGLARYATAESVFGQDFLPDCSPEESKAIIVEKLLELLPQATQRDILKLIG